LLVAILKLLVRSVSWRTLVFEPVDPHTRIPDSDICARAGAATASAPANIAGTRMLV